jgi:trehalose 6-phosphate phosphatase
MVSRTKHTPPPAKPEWAYFLDVDGTLIDIAESPDAVKVDARLLALLRRLRIACGGALALVTGREVSNLESLLGDFRPPISGQHGLERRTANGTMRSHTERLAAKREISRRLEPVLSRYPGLLLEDKGLTLALHYRQAPQLASYVHRLMREIIAGAAGELCLQSGKRVVEIKPVGFDKGTAISEFMAEAPFRGRKPIFLGDDTTDEHGFGTVNRMGGLSVKVGRGRTVACCRLRNVGAVRAWLTGAVCAHKAEEVR